MSIHTIIEIDKNEYQMFIDLVGTSEQLPATYEQWLALHDDDVKKQSSRKNTVKYANVKYQGYVEYLGSCGFEPSFELLGAYAVALTSKST